MQSNINYNCLKINNYLLETRPRNPYAAMMAQSTEQIKYYHTNKSNAIT
jgi:hypothetical protein